MVEWVANKAALCFNKGLCIHDDSSYALHIMDTRKSTAATLLWLVLAHGIAWVVDMVQQMDIPMELYYV